MQTILIFLVVLLAAILIISLIAMVQAVKRMKEMVSTLEKSVNQLSSRVQAQEVQLAEIRQTLSKQSNDPLLQVMEVFSHVRNKGWLGAVAVIGGRVFRSYFQNRRAKALPVKSIDRG